MSKPSACLVDVTWVWVAGVAGAAGAAGAAVGSATSAATLSAMVERAAKRDIVLPLGQRPGQRIVALRSFPGGSCLETGRSKLSAPRRDASYDSILACAAHARRSCRSSDLGRGGHGAAQS